MTWSRNGAPREVILGQAAGHCRSIAMTKGRILVTGGAGYIGSHTCKALSRAGYEPITFDSMVYGHEWAVKWGPLIKADIQDGQALDAVFAQYKPIAVMHFAAFAYVGESVSDPEKYYRNNVAGTLSLLSAMRRAGCENIVFSSTCATYGVPMQLPLREDHPQKPINPYGWTKLMMEQTLRDFDHAYAIKHASLRYFNAAGADPEGEIGEDHDPETHLIPLVVYATQGRRGHVEISAPITTPGTAPACAIIFTWPTWPRPTYRPCITCRTNARA